MLALGVTIEFTRMLTPLEVAIVEVKQAGRFPLACTMALTTSLLEGMKEKLTPVPCATSFFSQV